jgi:hypothetical protein
MPVKDLVLNWQKIYYSSTSSIGVPISITSTGLYFIGFAS